MKKKIFVALAAIVLIGKVSTAYALTTIDENITEERLTSGVILKNYDRFTEKGWLNINILEVDLKDEYTEVGLLNSSDGLNTFQTVYQMANKEDNVVAAINGDFFNGTSVNGNTIGLSIKDGKILTTTYYENETKDTFASFILDEENEAWFDYFTHKVTLKNKKNKKELSIAEYNKVSTNYEYPVLYTSDWGPQSYGSKLSLTEMFVVNGKVKEIRENGEPFEIPEDGFVIATYGETAKQMMEDFKKGNRVELDVEMDLDIEAVKMAVSGGAILLENGEIPEKFTANITGSNPRTAIGLSEDGETLYLITVDGRQASSIGMTQKELAEFLKEKGIYNAMNLDGGGSTTMIGRKLGELAIKTINSPSGITLRKVTNAIGVHNTSKTGSLANIVVKIPEENVFVNSKRKIEILGYDKYYNPVEVDFDDFDFEVDGAELNIEDGYIYSTDEVGTSTITVKKGRISKKISIDVLSSPNEIEITPKKSAISLDDSIEYSFRVKNKNGYLATLENDEFKYEVVSGEGKFDGNKFIPSKEGNHIIAVSVGNAKSYALVTVGESKQKAVESFEKENFKFVSYPIAVTGMAEVSDEERYDLENSAKLEYDFTTTDATRAAYLRFNEPVKLDEEAIEISFKVYSEEYLNDYIKLKMIDAKGNTQLLMASKEIPKGEWTEIKYNLNSIALPATLTDIYVAQDHAEIKNKGTIYIDDLRILSEGTSEIKDSVLPNDIKGKDELEKSSDLTSGDSLKIIIYDKIEEETILLDKLKNKKIEQTINSSSDVVIFTNQEDETLLENINTEKIISKGYETKEKENAIFINIDVSSGGLRTTDYNQWINLSKEIKETKQKNVIIIMNGTLENFKDNKEKQLFVDTLCEIKRATSKNIWVIHDGENSTYSMERGIKYLSINNKTIDEKDPLNVAKETKYLEITISEDNKISYEYKKIF